MISKDIFPNFKKKFDVVSSFIDYNGKTLLLHRNDDKPQGNTWGIPAGKVHDNEDMLDALIREVGEEVGLITECNQYRYFDSYYVRYPDYDFMYHVYHLPFSEKPVLTINPVEHKDHRWLTPVEALRLPLIEDEDSCIKWFYKV